MAGKKKQSGFKTQSLLEKIVGKTFGKSAGKAFSSMNQKVNKAVPILGKLDKAYLHHIEAGVKALVSDFKTFDKGMHNVIKQVGKEMRMPHGAKASNYKIVGGALGLSSAGIVHEALKSTRKKSRKKKSKVPHA